MNVSMKLNAVKALMESLEFNQNDKQALVDLLNAELKPVTQTEKTTQVVPIGERQKFEMLFANGTTGYYQRIGDKPVGIIINRNGLHFAIYCRQHDCRDGSNRGCAQRYASSLEPVCGKNWCVIREEHCRAINNREVFADLCAQLKTLGCRPIVASRTKEVLTEDGSLTAKDWEVWFVMDL